MKKKVVLLSLYFFRVLTINRSATWVKIGKIIMEKRLFKVLVIYTYQLEIPIPGAEGHCQLDQYSETLIMKAFRPLDILISLTKGHFFGWSIRKNSPFWKYKDTARVYENIEKVRKSLKYYDTGNKGLGIEKEDICTIVVHPIETQIVEV